MTTVARALDEARHSIPVSEARQLLRYVLGCTAASLVANSEETLAANHVEGFNYLVEQRSAGIPLAYVIGTREFYGRDFMVTPAVLIPRPETELLVELSIDRLKSARFCQAPRILDLATGSGCVAVCLAAELPQARVAALDVSSDALLVAQQNAMRHEVALELIESDWFAAVNNRFFDLIVANPPYIPCTDPHLRQGDLRFEPQLALACGADGLDAIRTIVADAPRHLLPGGWLLCEHGYDQAERVLALLQAAGYLEIQQHRDLGGILRVSVGRVAR